MGYDPKVLDFVRETIEELGEGGYKGLEPGVYHVAVAEESEVAEYSGLPTARIALKVVEGEATGATTSVFLGWFVAETSERSKKPYEERLRITREITRAWGRDLLSFALNTEGVDAESANALNDAFRQLRGVRGDTEEDMTEAVAALEGLVDALQGHDFYVRVVSRKKGDGTNTYLIKYAEGMEKVAEGAGVAAGY